MAAGQPGSAVFTYAWASGSSGVGIAIIAPMTGSRYRGENTTSASMSPAVVDRPAPGHRRAGPR